MGAAGASGTSVRL
ncbi:hypothetical protein CIB84_008949 [Bambusicola thoracicus]|uniref:Uncharacterized protein n=1 Tax=Bambusicola thoracicus TaxID=9083 RepID=A0A2P4ST75_BAMTH|nr:hypothetical protein CIB84_008949 [Bambusicola thoracicus]